MMSYDVKCLNISTTVRLKPAFVIFAEHMLEQCYFVADKQM